MQKSRLALRYFREQRREAVRLYAGAHWSEEAAQEKQPVNLIALYCSVMGRNLMAKSPRVLISTFKRPQKAAVSAMQDWSNQQLGLTGFEETMQRTVLDALFSVGILKVAIADPSDAAISGWEVGAGTPFAQRVDLDDFVYDLHARSFKEVSFIGHRYRAPLDVIKDSKHYSKSKKKLAASEDPLFNQEGDERISVLGRSTYAANTEEFEDFVDLWEIYLPRHGLVITLADDQLSGISDEDEPLRVQQWLGPYCGPYHILGYGIIPGNAMPKGPIQDLVDLHEFCNRSLRKLMRQADRSKEMTAFQAAADGDAARINEASDGDWVRVDNPDKIKPFITGQVNQSNFALFMAMKQMFAYMAGNLDMMGGLSPQSKTLGQDRMLEENSSRSVADMQSRTIHFASEVIESLCWYWWHDPFRIMKTSYSVQGVPEAGIQRTVTPQMRQGDFYDLQVKIDPYSMQHATPQSRLAMLTQAFQQFIMPAMPLLAQQGIVVDLNGFLRYVSEYADLPELKDVLTIREPIEQQGQGMTSSGMAPETTRNYVRENKPGRTEQGDAMNMTNALMGVDVGGAPERNGAMMMQ